MKPPGRGVYSAVAAYAGCLRRRCSDKPRAVREHGAQGGSMNTGWQVFAQLTVNGVALGYPRCVNTR